MADASDNNKARYKFELSRENYQYIVLVAPLFSTKEISEAITKTDWYYY
jgi:hypothetical protein